MVDGEIHLTTAKINSKPIPENVFLCQNPAKDNAQGNNIILSFENRDQTRIAPNKHAQDYVQSVQILVDQMAKGTLCMFSIALCLGRVFQFSAFAMFKALNIRHSHRVATLFFIMLK